MIYKSYLLIFLSLFLVGCFGGSSKSKTDSPSNNVAYLYDGALGNVDYFICNNSNDKKQTNSDGKFLFDSNCNVDFYLGDKIHLGQIAGQSIENLNTIRNNKKLVYITNILGFDTYDTTEQKVKNLAKFLISLDSDSDPDNGIDINDSIKLALNQPSINALDFTNDITEETLNNTLLEVVSEEKIVSEAFAVSHLEKSLREILGGTSVDNQGPPTPYLIDKYTSLSTDLTAIRTKHTKVKTVRLKGESETTIMMAFNHDGNMSNLDFNTTSYKINDMGYYDLPLVFDNEEESYFHYYLKLIDDGNNTSNILHLNVTKDHIPPFVKDSFVEIATPEEQTFLSNIFSFDESDVQFYKIIDSEEDSFSVNHELFSIDENGSIDFHAAPDFEEFPNAVYYVVARARDIVGNITDVYFAISLYNILDNPPTLTNTQYTTSILEALPNGSFIYDLNGTLETNLTIAPDNDPTLSPIYFKIHNHEDIVEINESTGRLIIKDSFDNFYDRERLPNSIDINFSVENNNTHPNNDINITYATLTVNIDNKIDTTPVLLNGPYSFSLDEKIDEDNNRITIFDENIIDFTNSDVNPTMYFSISAIYPDINSTFEVSDENVTNTLFRLSNHNIEYEQQNQYILTLRATNEWYDGTFHFDEVNITININDVVDEPPIIELTTPNEVVVTEAAPIGTVVANVDLCATGFVDDVIDGYRLRVSRYPFAESDPFELVHPFDINFSTGEVYISSDLDDFYTEENLIVDSNDTNDTRYKFSIIAFHYIFDGTEQNAQFVPEVDINITNVIDNPPLIVGFQLENSLEENASINTPIATFELNSSNNTFDSNYLGQTSDVPYVILNNTHYNNTFQLEQELNGTHAILRLQHNNSNGGIDWELMGEHTITVAAQNRWPDIDNQLHTGNEVNITITVDNVVENGPVLVCPSEPIEVHENSDQFHIVDIIKTNYKVTDRYTKDTSIINDFNMTIHPDFEIVNDDTFFLERNENKPIDVGLLYLSSLGGGVRGGLDYDETLPDINNTVNLLLSAWNEANNTQTYGNECNITLQIVDDMDPGVPILTVPINLNDVNNTFEDSDFDLYINVLNELNTYYTAVSKNKFSFTVDTINNHTAGIAAADVNRSFVQAFDSTTRKNYIKEALTYLNTQPTNPVNFSQFDSDNDGNITSQELQILFIIPESPENNLSFSEIPTIGENTYYFENNSNPSNDVNMTLDSGTILLTGSYSIIGSHEGSNELSYGKIVKFLASSTLGFKLGDATNYQFNNYGLMGDGYTGFQYTGNGANKNNPVYKASPVHPTIFNKLKQGWASPITLKTGVYGYGLNGAGFEQYNDETKVELFNANTQSNQFNAFKVIDKNNVNIHYLIENRATDKLYNYDGEDNDVEAFELDAYPTIFQNLYDDAIDFLDPNYDEGGIIIWEVTTNSVRYLGKVNVTNPLYENDSLLIEVTDLNYPTDRDYEIIIEVK